MRISPSPLLPSSLLPEAAQRRLNEPWVIAGVLLAVVAAASMVCYRIVLSSRNAELTEAAWQQQLMQRLLDAKQLPALVEAPYAERLPIEPYPVSRAVEHLRKAAGSQSVNVVALNVTERASSSNTLGRVTVDFSLRGGYVAIKAVLNELLSRDEKRVVLQQLSIRRAPATANFGTPTGDLEAQVSVSWLHRPLSAGSLMTTAGVPPRSERVAAWLAPASGPDQQPQKMALPPVAVSSSPRH